jgi:uncharacterized phiE125 gp8 family phage protein
MSSIRPESLDRNVLPAALLSIAKSHLRIDGTFEDYLVQSTIGRAISWFERVTNVSVNKVTWIWQPNASVFCNGRAQVPVTPVNSFTVVNGVTDISGEYAIESMSTHGVGLYVLLGSFVSGMKVTIPSGYADLGSLDPGITDALLRYTAHLYENREILVPGVNAQTPGWMTDVISTYWVPRA